jgi:hypothetical protein
MLACGAQYSPEFPSAYAKLLKNPKKWDRLAELWAKESLGQKALLGTTQAIDVSPRECDRENASLMINRYRRSSTVVSRVMLFQNE